MERLERRWRKEVETNDEATAQQDVLPGEDVVQSDDDTSCKVTTDMKVDDGAVSPPLSRSGASTPLQSRGDYDKDTAPPLLSRSGTATPLSRSGSGSVCVMLEVDLFSEISNEVEKYSTTAVKSISLEWEESCSLERAEWAVILQQLKQLLPLELLLQSAALKVQEDSEATLKMMLDKGKGSSLIITINCDVN